MFSLPRDTFGTRQGAERDGSGAITGHLDSGSGSWPGFYLRPRRPERGDGPWGPLRSAACNGKWQF